MLTHLKLCKYRGFESYELADLARVNLLVGKKQLRQNFHSRGRTLSGLEKGDPSVLAQVAQRRGEDSIGYDEDVRHGQKTPRWAKYFALFFWDTISTLAWVLVFLLMLVGFQ